MIPAVKGASKIADFAGHRTRAKSKNVKFKRRLCAGDFTQLLQTVRFIPNRKSAPLGSTGRRVSASRASLARQPRLSSGAWPDGPGG